MREVSELRAVDVAVVGAGAAGLAAAFLPFLPIFSITAAISVEIC